MDTTKLTAFAQAVGVDIKELKQLINGKVDSATLTQAIEQAKTAVKNDLLGDGVPENLNTLKEIAEEIAKMSGSTEGAVVQKLADLGRRIDEFANLDLVATYNAAKA
ncbi:hypothetical protein [Streptococcus mitis]|uniref:Phage protein n=1 Tax=Streptococcus mitis TaxID=28037 RepID=A0A150NVR4_STRMT|nr:hypothetical protein [Streptococcus mitis]KYF36252.1 Phage protein [Streptococcus mitis]KYF37542.1 Phage protein [Streptococcus mitis]QBX26336.1 hypothetical protein Javan316_0047 [Streptococcus phage Javan316]